MTNERKVEGSRRRRKSASEANDAACPSSKGTGQESGARISDDAGDQEQTVEEGIPLTGEESPGGSAAAIYAEYVNQKLNDENNRQSSVEQRGIAVVTTAGVLTTALFGIAAFVHPKDGTGVTRSAHGPLVVAIVLLVLSAVCALLTNLPLFYQNVKVEELQSAVKELWGDHPDDAMQRIAATHVKEIEDARKRNSFKAWILVLAIVLEVASLIPLGIAVFQVVQHPVT